MTMAVQVGTYPMPPYGWTCFHCGETFTTQGSARDHFGETPARVPGCIIKAGEELGLLMMLRKVEQENDRLQQAIVDETITDERYRTRLEQDLQGFKPFAGCRDLLDVFNLYDSIGRPCPALAAEKVTPPVRSDVDSERLVDLSVQFCDRGEVWELGPLDRPDLRSLLGELISYRRRALRLRPGEPLSRAETQKLRRRSKRA